MLFCFENMYLTAACFLLHLPLTGETMSLRKNEIAEEGSEW